MAYASIEETKSFAQNDDLNPLVIEMLLGASSDGIDRFCGRSFTPVIGARSFDFQETRRLALDTGLVSVTGITTTGGQSFTAADVDLTPAVGPPYYWITLKASTSYTFQYGLSPEGAITVTGTWGYKSAVPASIRAACIMWALDLYNKRDVRGMAGVNAGGASAQLLAATDQPPADVLPLIRPYKRILIGRLSRGNGLGSIGG